MLDLCQSKSLKLSCVFQGRNTDYLPGSDTSYVSQNFGTEESHSSENGSSVCVCVC